jgi:glycosyltransferase involved in cell wall biosynthesis
MSAGATPRAPEVSVVIGVRNGAAGIAAAVRSILAQRDVDLELIVVDDGSTDGTPSLLSELADEDQRLRIVRQEAAGLTAALIRGCAEARGAYIARQDADEVSRPERLRRQLTAFAGHHDLALVSCWTAHVAPRGEPVRVEQARCEPDRPLPLFERSADGRVRVLVGPSQHGSAMFPAALYRRVGGYRTPFAVAQDWDLWLRLGAHGRFLMVGETLLTTTLDPGSLSFRARETQFAIAELARESLEHTLRGESDAAILARVEALSQRLSLVWRRGRRRKLALGLYHIGEGLRRQRHPAALFYLTRALGRNPFLLRAWVRAAQAILALSAGAHSRSPVA